MRRVFFLFCLAVYTVFSQDVTAHQKICTCKGGLTLGETQTLLQQRRFRRAQGPTITKRYEATAPSGALPDAHDSVKAVLVICQSEQYDEIADNVSRYISDIQRAYGCAVTLQTLSASASVTTLKEMIQTAYKTSQIDGAILIGNLPVAFFYHEKYDQTFPCDYYLMELDGEWKPLANDSLEIFTENPDNWGVELFVGRISTTNSGAQDELAALKAYFDKNHAFWSGETTIENKRALTATDRDWATSEYFHDDIQYLYDDQSFDAYYYVYDPDDILNKNNAYNPTAYLNKISSGEYSFVQLACHSDEKQHHFYEYDYYDSEFHIHSDAIKAKVPRAVGYNLFCCYAGNWTTYREGVEEDSPGYLAASYIYNESPTALTAVASTKSGGMLAFKKFYKPLGRGDAMGSAFKIWHDEQKAYYDKYSTLKQSGYITWYYGLVLLGDPMISFHYDSKAVHLQSNKQMKVAPLLIGSRDKNKLIISKEYGAVSLFTLQGKKVRSAVQNTDNITLSLDGLATGIYTIFGNCKGNRFSQQIFIP